MDDRDLLQDYANTGSEAAFAELVRRHIDWVYSVALRQVRDPHLAEDVVQSVFALLARKARGLRPGTVPGGWLFRSTCFLAKCALRAERRRKIREEVASKMNTDPTTENDQVWQELSPLLDRAVAALSEADRTAVLLRFYEKLSLSEVGARLGISEEAAKKRVSRAIEKLRDSFSRRGVALGSFALAAVLLERTVHAAPTGLGAAIAGAPAAGSGALPALAREAVDASRWARIKLLTATTCSVLILALLWHRAATGRWLASEKLATSQFARQKGADLKTNSIGANVAGANTATSPGGPGFLFRVSAAEDAHAIPGARVLINQVAGDEWVRGKELTTDADGYCTVPLQPNLSRLDVGALKDGFVQKFYTWREDSGEQLPPFYVLKLGRAVRIGGHVQDTEGKPISGAEIGVMFHGISDSTAAEPAQERLGFLFPEIVITQTDAQGNWHCAVTPPRFEDFSISIQHPKFVQASFPVNADWKKAVAPADLWAGKAVMVLEPGFEARGDVLDEAGNPLGGARVSWMHNVNYRQDGVQTAPDGSFRMTGLPRGHADLSAWAKGFAPLLMGVEIGSRTPELVFRLNRGVSVPLRIVDEDTNGIPGAWAALDLPLPHNSDLQVRTDGEGRATFAGIPTNAATGLVCHAGAKGYFYSRDVRVNAGVAETTIRLSKSLRVTGQVLDAETREVVIDFKAIPCHGQEAGGYDRSETKRGQGGSYTVEFSELSFPFRVRIEAEGYEPAMSGPIPAQPSEQRQDFLLQKKNEARAIRGRAMTAEGEPAANISVALLTFEAGATLVHGTFKRGEGAILTTTDAHGEFKFDPNPQAHTIVAADPIAGFARLRMHRSTPPFALQLRPWGRIEGQVVLSGQPASGQDVSISPGLLGYRSVREGLYAPDETATDAAGRFAFELLPPADYTLHLSQGTARPLSHSTPVEVRSGETAAVQIGGNGLRVSGKFTLKGSSKVDWQKQLIFASLVSNTKPPAVHPPPDAFDLAGKLRLLDFFDQSEEWHAYELESASFPLEVAPDGRFSVEDIKPGAYRLNVSLSDSPFEGGDLLARVRRNRIASVTADVTVPAGTDEQQPIDLGTFELAPNSR